MFTARPERRHPKLLGISVFAILLFAVGTSLSVLSALQVRADVNRGRSARLAEKARQTTNLFTTITNGVGALLATGAVAGETTHGNAVAFRRVVGSRLGGTLLSNATLFDLSRAQPVERSSAGASSPVLLRPLTRTETRLLREAAATGKFVVVAHGTHAGTPVVGVAAGAAPGSKWAAYGEISVPRAVSFGGLTGVSFAFYFGSESRQNLLASNTTSLPIRGSTLKVRLELTNVAQTPILVYGSREGVGFDTLSPWLVLAGGVAFSLLLAFEFDLLRRRRDGALAQAEINRHQALHDALTGLPNRTFFNQMVDALAKRSTPAAVLLADLDRFKEINDTLGHHSGDALLQELGERLRHSVRSGDMVARLGGDEFGILLHPCDTAGMAIEIAERLREELRRPIQLSELSIEIDGSIGIAFHPNDGEDAETLIRHADIALYRSKTVHAPVVYTPDTDHYSPARLQLVSDLRKAIEDGEILVYYQPQAEAAGGVRSVEALVRWAHPELGLLPPDEFIPLAEQTGMIRPLTRYVLGAALHQCRAWMDKGYRIGVAVNVGARDLLDAGFPDEVSECLGDADVPAELLELEITEDTLFADFVRAHAVITRLHERGVRFAVDDFGAGQTALTYLKRLPINVLKIDKSFVLDMDTNADDAAIVQTAIDLGRNLGLTVVAEGVETVEVRRLLVALGCNMVQGFELSRPRPAEEIETLFDAPEAQAAA